MKFLLSHFVFKITQSYLFGHIAEILGVQHGFVELDRGAGWSSQVCLGVKGPEGMAEITAVSPFLQYVQKVLLMLLAWPAQFPVLEKEAMQVLS